MIIETNALRKTYTVRAGRQNMTVEAVAGIDLGVKEAEIFGFLGPNGAGKTTTMHMLATLIEPDSGDATVVGADLRREANEVRRRLGYVSQQGGTCLDVTAREELVLQARMYGFGKAEAKRRAERLLEDFQLTEFADRRCRTYSGGQRRRVDIACGVIHEPKVVLLDEPSAGLDPVSRSALWDELRRLRDRGTTIVLTTHYLDEADALCDRMVIIDHGSIVADGTPTELKAQVAGDVVMVTVAAGAADAAVALRGHQRVEQIEVVDDHRLRLFVQHGSTAIPLVLKTLNDSHIVITELTLHQPSLDDVFIAKTGRSLREPSPAEGSHP